MNGDGNGVERMLNRLDILSEPKNPVTDGAAGLARRFIVAYGEPDYWLDWSTSCLYFDWKHYTVEIYPDGRIALQGDANGETLLDNTGHMGRLARIGSAVREATGFGGFTRTRVGQAAADPAPRDGMRRVTFPSLTAFHPDMQRADKQQIAKILEETAELSVAANDFRKRGGEPRPYGRRTGRRVADPRQFRGRLSFDRR